MYHTAFLYWVFEKLIPANLCGFKMRFVTDTYSFRIYFYLLTETRKRLPKNSKFQALSISHWITAFKGYWRGSWSRHCSSVTDKEGNKKRIFSLNSWRTGYSLLNNVLGFFFFDASRWLYLKGGEGRSRIFFWNNYFYFTKITFFA